METSVKFLESPRGDLWSLEVRAPGVDAVMLDLVRVLFRMRVEVLITNSPGLSGSVERLLLRDQDGTPLAAERRAQLQAAILDTIERTLRERVARVRAREERKSLIGSEPRSARRDSRVDAA